ncbi:unnamed protein product, partial [Choristocarpus tenellus]
MTEVIFVAAVCHPRKQSNGVWFDGKMRICPIMDTKVAKCSSIHRPKGKVLVPAMMDRERYKKLMIEDVIQAVKAHMPRPEDTPSLCRGTGQSHTSRKGSWRKLRRRPWTTLSYKTQPANSADVNVNDLGLFHSIQQLRGRHGGYQHRGAGGGHNGGVRFA